ncbi:MAG TPA: hypothetical protein VFS08_15810 [Gemmatimonadaceae bacterium]|nr:hypothetical protein [Gemmatimonadaceae bacterium]
MRAPQVVRAADSPEQFVEGVVARLFRGITLTAAQQTAAREVTSRITAEQSRVDLRSRAGWDRLLGLHRERDAELAALLTSEIDRSTFEVNATELRRGQEEIAVATLAALDPQ